MLMDNALRYSRRRGISSCSSIRRRRVRVRVRAHRLPQRLQAAAEVGGERRPVHGRHGVAGRVARLVDRLHALSGGGARRAAVRVRAAGCACGYYHTVVVAQAPAIDEEEDAVNPLLAQAAALTGGAAPGRPLPAANLRNAPAREPPQQANLSTPMFSASPSQSSAT